MNNESLIKAQNLSVDFAGADGVFHAVKNVSFEIKRGQTMALVGESGSGKSVTALSIMQLLPYPLASHPAGSSITFEGEELVGQNDRFMRRIRGAKIGMIFQEPLTALNPLHTIEKQIGEILRLHQGMDKAQARSRTLELLDLVGLPQLKSRLGAYPHELSGGQRQRVMIAMALANNPALLIADEPTTALDVTVQAQILELLQDLKTRLNMALLLITHDLSIVEKMADHIGVMQHGEMVEQGSTKDIFERPSHEYTKRLLAAQPRGNAKAKDDNAAVLMEGKDVRVHFPKTKTLFGKLKDVVKAVDNIDIVIKKGHTLGVVGESGSGKSTLGLALLKLQQSGGSITFNGQDITDLNRKSMRPLRSKMQIVFQDPFGSLSPRMSVGRIIGEGLELHRQNLSKEEREALIIKALESVHMNPETRHRYPHEFSGGQRQRIAIARAMVLEPDFVMLDEPTSALDVSVQAEIVDLLRELQEKHDLTYLFISHDLRVVRAMAHDILVMKDGKIVESGTASQIFENPRESYTKALIDAALNLKARAA